MRILLTILFALIIAPALANAQAATEATTESATEPTTAAGPLQITVTAVQGGAQYRPDSKSKWQAVTVGLDLSEGVEFRTGPKGTIQFTVGTDQVYRVDRLTVVKMLRANLNPDGTIRTDVGMTYGRVSKDVDLPSRPHQDTIISPSSTLAVRGTRVSLYDQPPYAPEAVSLTGAANYKHLNHPTVHLGAHGSGKAKVNADSSGPGEYQLTSNLIDPNGEFSGRTDTEIQTLLATLGGLSGNQLGVFQSLASTNGIAPATTVIGAVPVPGELQFEVFWTTTTPGTTANPNTVVQFGVTSPLGDTASLAKPISPSGGSFNTNSGQSPIASFGFGFEEVDWGAVGQAFPNGKYKITTTLEGAVGQPLTSKSNITITENIFAEQNPFGGVTASNPGTSTFLSTVTLSAKNPTESFKVPVPIFDNESVEGIDSSGKKTTIKAFGF
jgi:hypothetical protein